MSTLLSAADLAAQLRSGAAALFPTDTLPALASRPEHARQLWELKQRPQNKPLILMGASAEELWQWLGSTPEPAWLELANQHWPGALTLVVPAARRLVDPLNPGGDSLGLRVPACDAALELLRLSGPLATTSANRSGEEPSLTAQEAAERFPQVARLAPEPWPRPSGQASTVLRWYHGDWQVLRRGAVLPATLASPP
ncbi:MAG: L-threonylcarbamoyladenylate synthase [Vulcanococcus sp.]